MAGSKEKSKIAFNQQAPTYDNGVYSQHARALYPVLLAELSRRTFENVLDLGCGTGEMLKLILHSTSDIKAYGIDLSENMLSVAKKKLGDRATLILGDAEQLPFEDETFDAVYCNDSFHHYPAPERAIEEVHRVLKAGGFFLIGDCWQPGAARLIMNCYMRHSRDGGVRIYSERELKNLLSGRFHSVEWHRVGGKACVAYGEK